MQKINVVIFGIGYWGANVLRNLFKFNDVCVSIVEPDREKWGSVKYGDLDFFSFIDEVLEWGIKPDAAIICTPVSSHYSLAKRLLENKIHVLCQKPLVETVAQAQELTKIAKSNDVKLMGCFTYVFHPGIRKISMSAPDLGKKLYYNSTRINLGIIQRDVNIIHDLFCHDAAILYYLTYKLPKFVSAVGGCHNKNKFVDVANISMGYDDGFVANVTVNWLSPIKNRTIILGCENKMVTFDDCAIEKVKIFDTGFAPKGDVFDYRTGDILTPKIDGTEAIYEELYHFFESVRYGMEPLTNGGFSINVLRMIEAANKSMEKNGEPIVP